MSTWPDPENPGVPLNPERDGWHWIVGWSDKLFVAEWDSDEKDYVWFDGGDAPSGIVENGWTYAGPVLKPAEADALRAENARLREALTWYGQDYDYEKRCSQWDGGAKARAALDPDGQKERRAKALAELAEMDADLLDIDPEVKP